MGKIINCKHGLDKKQEIEARRVRRKIEENDKETWAEIIKLREQWLEQSGELLFPSFLLEQGHTVLSSAIMRIADKQIINKIYFKNEV